MDFQKGNKTEYHSLTEYITFLGDELNIPTPNFGKITEHFKQRKRI
jgi:ketopantoate reductase